MGNRTFNPSKHIISFDLAGNIVNQNPLVSYSRENVCANSKRFLSLLDISGRKLDTQVKNLLANKPNYVMLVVRPQKKDSMSSQSIQLLQLSLALDIPIMVVVTHCELIEQDQLEDVTTIEKRVAFHSSDFQFNHV